VLDTAAYTTSCRGGIASPSPLWQGPEDLSGKLWLRWDEQRFYVRLALRDDAHRQTAGSLLDVWQGDSVQYGFDGAGNARTTPPDGWDATDDSEWEAALFEGRPVLLRVVAPGAPPAGPVEGVAFPVRREAQVTTYVAAFPWEVLAPAAGEEGTIFGFNFIANDDDGEGREGWLGITPGIGESKAPRMFRKVLLVR
jgi:hypothetical protein